MGWEEYLKHEKIETLQVSARSRKWKRIAVLTGLPWDEARELGRFLRSRLKPAAEAVKPAAEAVKLAAEAVKPAAEASKPNDYEYNAATQTYVFRVAGIARNIVLSTDRVDSILADYSNVTGKPATINQVARTHDLPRPVVIGILRALGKTHDSLPFTEERLGTASENELRDEARQLRQLDVYRKIEQDKWREYKRDAEKWRAFREHTLEPLKRWFAERAPTYAPPKIRIRKPREPFTLVVGLTDEHWGKRGVGGYGRETQRTLYLELIERLIGRVELLGRPAKIIIPIGSDGLHIDTSGGTTTQGTPQDVDGSPLEIASSWVEYKVEQIDALTQLAPVELWPMQGNHDRFASALMTEAVRAWFSQRQDVQVYGTIVDPVIGQLYGETLLCVHHGDKLRVKALSEVIPKRFAREWGLSRWRYCFTGHYHTERDLPQRSDLQIIRWPSATGADRWHVEEGYDGSRRALAAHAVSPTLGVVQAFNEPVTGG